MKKTSNLAFMKIVYLYSNNVMLVNYFFCHCVDIYLQNVFLSTF